jgi:hypothetical protein
MNNIIFVLFGKYYLIVDQLGSKNSSRDFQLNCIISYFLSIFNTSYKRLKINVTEKSEKIIIFGCIPWFQAAVPTRSVPRGPCAPASRPEKKEKGDGVTESLALCWIGRQYLGLGLVYFPCQFKIFSLSPITSNLSTHT